MSQPISIFHPRWIAYHSSVTLLLILVFCISSAFGQDTELSATELSLAQLDKALEKEQGISQETKDALTNVIRALRAERLQKEPQTRQQQAPTRYPVVSKGDIAKIVDEYLTTRPPRREKTALDKLQDRLKLYGDFRLRHESNFSLDDKPDRHRERIRFRVGANYQLSDEFLFGARIITGDLDDPRSSHQTTGNGFNSFDVSLDRVFLTYRPDWANGTWFTAGKFNHPFYRNPVYGELVWDADVQPEGIVLGYTFPQKNGSLEKLNLILGEYTVLEQSTADNAFATVFQGSGRWGLSDKLKMDLALSYYFYTDPTPDGSRTILGDNAGNATVDTDGDGDADEFRSDFGILNPIIAFNYDGWKYPLTFSGEYILNTLARDGNDQGMAAGVALGKTQKKGDWKAYYQWQLVEQDAVFSPFSQDDFLFRTNHRSHVFGLRHQLRDNIGLHLWGLVSALDETSSDSTTYSDRDQWRLRLDLDIKF